MLGRILIVDQIATNRIAMRAKLGAAQFHVNQARSIEEALIVINRNMPDLVLCDTRLPDGNAANLIHRISQIEEGGRKPPVIVLSEGLSERTRMDLLSAGANDVIMKPVDNLLLLARIRSHMRAAHSDTEWHMRDDTSRALGLADPAARFITEDRVRLVGTDSDELQQLADRLGAHMPNTRLTIAPIDDVIPDDPAGAGADAFVLKLSDSHVPEMLRLLSTLRCHRMSRHAAILVIQDEPEAELAAYALDMGASDLVTSEASLPEVALRLSVLLERKRQSDWMRASVRTGLEAAVCDPLTGLHNRRYAMPHLERILDRAVQTRKPVAVMLADMDHFKRINDTHGHSAGDQVLIQTAERLRENLRAVDLVARIGGEEFLIALPGVTLENAQRAAERLCRKIREAPFKLPESGHDLIATISIGMTVFEPFGADNRPNRVPEPQALIEQADTALYNAKAKGRNRVLTAKPAA